MVTDLKNNNDKIKRNILRKWDVPFYYISQKKHLKIYILIMTDNNKSLCRIWHGDFVRKGGKQMGSNETKVKKAMDIVLERLDYIIDYYTIPDFVEVTGKIGGDVITDRIYDDGSVYA